MFFLKKSETLKKRFVSILLFVAKQVYVFDEKIEAPGKFGCVR